MPSDRKAVKDTELVVALSTDEHLASEQIDPYSKYEDSTIKVSYNSIHCGLSMSQSPVKLNRPYPSLLILFLM